MKKLYGILGLVAGLFIGYTLVVSAAPITPVTGGGTGTSTIPANGAILIGNGTGYSFVQSSTFGGGGSSTISINGVSSTVFTLNSSTYLGITASGTAFTFTNLGVTSTAGNWAGTWQGVNSTTFYLASNPSGYLSSSTGLTYFFPATTTVFYPTSNPTGFTTTTIASVLQSLSSAGTGLTYNSSTGVFTWTNPGYITTSTNNFGGLTNSSVTANSPILWSATSTISCPTCLTTSTGLTVSNFASANISQWTNNSGYITTSTNNFGGLTGNGTAGYVPVYTATGTLAGYINMTYSTSTNASGTLDILGNFIVGTSTTGGNTAQFYVSAATTGTIPLYVFSKNCTAGGADWVYMTDQFGDQFYLDNCGSLHDSAASFGGSTSANGMTASIIAGPANTGSDAINTTANVFIQGGTSATTTDALQINGQFGFSTSTLTLTSCGTSATSTVGSDNAGRITVGGAATGCTLNFSPVWKQVPSCTYDNQSMSITSALTYTVSTSSLVFSQSTGLGGDIINYNCVGLPN